MRPHNKELEDSVDRFLGYFKKKLALIQNIDFKESNCLFRKILYVSLLDALSRTTKTTDLKKNNQNKFHSFVKNFTDWKHQDNISLPHLLRFLAKIRDPEISPVREYAFSLYNRWESAALIKLDRDPQIQEIENHWPPCVSQEHLNNLRHVNLFYQARCCLIHEFREPGYGIGLEQDTEPFYHSYQKSPKEETRELVYPLGFYERICTNAIDNLQEYYMKERIDPYSRYNFGTYWIDKLNI